jgi:hypothetical protein
LRLRHYEASLKSCPSFVMNSEELNEGNAESAVDMSALRENVWRTRLYEKSKIDAALHNSVDDCDGAAIPAKTSKAGKY